MALVERMTAPSPSPVWPDEARMRAQVAAEDVAWLPDEDFYERMADAVLATVDPSRDTVLLGQVREIVARVGVGLDPTETDMPDSYICADAYDEIALLLAGGEG